MPQPRLVEADRIPPQPWRNGGGATRELYAWPPQGDWRLRVSLADIERDGPFSAFPGVRRHFAVLEGAGVELQFDGRWQRQTRDMPPLAFDGALAPDCRLVAGATRDLNLMCRGMAGEMLPAEVGACPRRDWPRRALFCGGVASLRVGTETLSLAPRSLLLELPADAELLAGEQAYWIVWDEAPLSPS